MILALRVYTSFIWSHWDTASDVFLSSGIEELPDANLLLRSTLASFAYPQQALLPCFLERYLSSFAIFVLNS